MPVAGGRRFPRSSRGGLPRLLLQACQHLCKQAQALCRDRGTAVVLPLGKLLPTSRWPLAVLSPAAQGHRLRGSSIRSICSDKVQGPAQVSPTMVPTAICIYKSIAMAAEICILIETSPNC